MATTTETEQTVTVTVGENDISFSTGRLAKQADGAVLVSSGETRVLATAVGRTEAREGIDFFPLTVDIEEKMYAAGKIPGGFFKREGKASERATLNARMVDRPIRPLWPKGFRNEVQIIGTVLSADFVAAHDVLAINGASAALMLSPLPFLGPVAAVRVGIIEGELDAQPDAARDGDLHARPDRLRLAGRDHHGRGRRQAGRTRTSSSRRSRWPTRRSSASAPPRSSCRPKAGKAKWYDAERQGRPRVALQRAARRGRSPRTAWPASRRPSRPWSRPSFPASPPTPARTSWCAATTCAWPPASSPTSAAPRPSSPSSPSSSAIRSGRCPTRSRTPRSSSPPSARP